MSAGLKALRKIQVVKEAGHASNSTATARLIGKLTMKQEQKVYRPDDLETGKLSSFERSYPIAEQMKGVFESDVNFEQIAYLLAMTIKGGVTPGAPTDSAYLWSFTPNLTAANNVDTFSFQYGDDIQAFLSSYVFGQDLEISGTMEEALRVKSNLVGRNVRTTTFTSLSNPTALTPIPMSTGKLYIDPLWANIGVTNVPATLIDFSYKVTPGLSPMKYGDGTLYFSDISEKKRHVEMDITLAFNSTVAGLYAGYFASPQTQKCWRLEFTGPTIGVTAKDKLCLDGAFIIDDYPEITERDGQDIVKLKLVSQYIVTGAAEWQILLTNNVASII